MWIKYEPILSFLGYEIICETCQLVIQFIDSTLKYSILYLE